MFFAEHNNSPVHFQHNDKLLRDEKLIGIAIRRGVSIAFYKLNRFDGYGK